MPAPAPYSEPTCRCGHGSPPASVAGRYRGLCEVGKAEKVEEARAARAAQPSGQGPTVPREDVEEKRRPKLARTVRDLVPLAEKLERSIDDRSRARTRALTALSDFKEGLAVVGRVAQSLVNHAPAPSDE